MQIMDGKVLLEITEDWVACIKPAGMDSETDMPRFLGDLLNGGTFYPVHRLDLNVSGLMIYARNRNAASELSRRMQNGEFRKEYLALVHGSLPSEGRMEDYLWKDSRRNKVYVVKRLRQGVRKAVLTWHVIGSAGDDKTLVAVIPETGRSHQIRVQFASRGFPLWGDHKYGARDREQALMLFSRRIRFLWNGKEICCEAEPAWPEVFPR